MLTDPVDQREHRLHHKVLMSRSHWETFALWSRTEVVDLHVDNIFDFAFSELLGIRPKTISPTGKRYAY